MPSVHRVPTFEQRHSIEEFIQVRRDMLLALEFAQRFATIRSPLEFLRVIEELTSKRMAMFQKYSKEMVDLSTKR